MIWGMEKRTYRYTYTDDIMGLEARWGNGHIRIVDTDTGDEIIHQCIYNELEHVRDLCISLVKISAFRKERGEKIK
jgi:hypothetical protein